MTPAQVVAYALGALGLIVFLFTTVLALTWLERKTLGRIQMRMGPMRVGPHGTLQPFADALKLVAKEDILPSWADRRVYWVAPLIVVVPAFLVWVTLPVGKGMVLRNLDLGLFYIVAVSVVAVTGLVMAGWGSANKYGALGSLRAAGQLISYEIPFIMTILAVAMLTQSLRLTDVVDGQATVGNVLVQPLGLFVFFLAGLAELGRTPFDIHHADSEVIAGPFIEYSGAHWAVFFLAEYINTFTLGVLTTLLFLGGWRWPTMPFDGPAQTALSVAWFFAKAYAVVLVIIWFRGTYPRLRIDQLMSLGWKVLVPLAFANIVVTGVVLFYGWPRWAMTLISATLLALTWYGLFKRPGTSLERHTITVHAFKARPRPAPAGAAAEPRPATGGEA